MTHTDPVTGETHEHDVEERVVTPAAPAAPAPAAPEPASVAPAPASVAPAPAPGEQVNVNAAGTRYVADPGPLAMVRRVVGLVFGVLVSLIALRVVLLALGANEGNAIVDAIYAISEPFVAPFRGVFSMDVVRPTGVSVIDVAAIVAMIGWSLIGLLVMAILRIPDRTAGTA
jgi:uncharacterized protein YggT (Ycf19 family)